MYRFYYSRISGVVPHQKNMLFLISDFLFDGLYTKRLEGHASSQNLRKSIFHFTPFKMFTFSTVWPVAISNRHKLCCSLTAPPSDERSG